MFCIHLKILSFLILFLQTVGFLLPAMHQILTNKKENAAPVSYSRQSTRTPKVLVIAPTRELSQQIELEAVKYAKSVDLRTACVFGGSPKFNQIKILQSGVDIVVGTPGRINDLIEMGSLKLGNISYLVLDEADRM